jgi:hypothetical protein
MRLIFIAKNDSVISGFHTIEDITEMGIKYQLIVGDIPPDFLNKGLSIYRVASNEILFKIGDIT